MKKLSLIVAILLLLSLVTGCKIQNPDNTGSSGDSTETTGSSQTQETGDTVSGIKVSNSKNIVTTEDGEYWRYTMTDKAVADYKNGYTPFVSSMDNGVLADGVTEISFETDYDIQKCQVLRASRVDDSDPDAELDSDAHKAKAKFDARKVTVDIGWWHASDSWTKTQTDWSYIINVKDSAGIFHNYYFRVKYATTDPVGLNDIESFSAYLSGDFGYRRAMHCTFEKPEDVPVFYFFYMGVCNKRVSSVNYTPEEEAFFDEAFGQINAGGPIKLPVADINKDLSVLGVTIEDVQIPDRWKYFDKTDSYYFVVSDAYGLTGITMTKAEKGEDGKVAIYWEIKEHWTSDVEPPIPGPIKSGSVKMVMTMQLQPDGTYRVLSNLPQE